MGFDLTDDQRTFNEHVDRFLGEACSVDKLHKAFDGDAGLTESIWRGQLDLGLGALVVPEDFGGLGLGLLEAASVAERIGFAGAPGNFIGHTLACLALARAGTPEQQAKYLPALAEGRQLGTVALMEGQVWDPDALTLSGSRLSGVKDGVLGLADADIAIVALAGGQLALVELEEAGVTRHIGGQTDKTRPVGRLELQNVEGQPLAEPWATELLEAASVLLAADAQGGAQRMVDDIVEYSKIRQQFGVTIASFQAVKHKLADFLLEITPNRPLYRQAAAAFDAQEPGSGALISTAKAHLAETFSAVARRATESYGGIGYTWEHAAHIWLRRSMLDYALFGSPADHRRRAAQLSGW